MSEDGDIIDEFGLTRNGFRYAKRLLGCRVDRTAEREET